ncbi:amidohydrolase family protein, partial [Clostridium saudiense]|nr:amidohydrolase family protein [Clostridium saudiense]
IEDFEDLVITPSLIDCHTHLLEYAPSTVYPVTNEMYNIAQKALVLQALMSGVTTFGEQICGSPMTVASVKDFKDIAKDLPANIVFSCNSITIGFKDLVNFTSVTGNSSVDKDKLIEEETIINLIENSDYPGENIFINATPANLTEDIVPRAGEVIYTQEELDKIVSIFHDKGKRIGCHVAGKEAIEMAIKAGFDVIHHGHDIS